MLRITALLYAVPLMTSLAFAQAPASAPAGSTGVCRDGSYSTAPVKKGACRGHKGVQDWYAASGAATGAVSEAAAPETATTAKAPVAAAAAAPATMAPAAPAAASKAMPGPAAVAAAGGGPGLVWVNTSSGVYHCSTDRWYGKTKNGAYMSEADAIAKGDHADHGKACAK